MIAEGGLKETITFLGWFINTHLLTIALTHKKATTWVAEIKTMQKNRKKVKAKDLQTLTGKLNHVCFVIPDARHFMNYLRKMEKLARFRKKVKLSKGAMDDLDLWPDFLKSAGAGILINRVVFRKPTITTFSDSSELGIGGFCPTMGIGWRHMFSPEEQQTFTLNTKEYTA